MLNVIAMNRKMLLLFCTVLFILFIFPLTIPAEATSRWSRTYGGPEYDLAESVIQTSDGGYAVAGATRSFGAGYSDFWLVKTNSLGSAEWNKTYGGTGEDVANSVIQTSDGGYALAGRTASYVWVVKTDSAGNMQWNKTYGSSGSISEASSIVQTSDGGYAVAGYTDFTPSVGGPFWLVKIDPTGNMQWNKTYGGNGASSVIQTSDGGYAMAGYIGSDMPDFWLVKTDSTGNEEWSKNYGGPGKDIAFSVVQANDGGYALAGWTYSFGGGGSNIWLVKTDSNGDAQWNKTYGGGAAWAMTKTSDGGYALAGTKLVKTDAEGNMQWNQTLSETGQDQIHSLVQTTDGGFALAGSKESSGGGSTDFWLVKTDEAGVIPEFPSWVTIPPFMVATLFAVIAKIGLFHRTRNKKQNKLPSY
jgi:hypothetical protein